MKKIGVKPWIYDIELINEQNPENPFSANR